MACVLAIAGAVHRAARIRRTGPPTSAELGRRASSPTLGRAVTRHAPDRHRGDRAAHTAASRRARPGHLAGPFAGPGRRRQRSRDRCLQRPGQAQAGRRRRDDQLLGTAFTCTGRLSPDVRGRTAADHESGHRRRAAQLRDGVVTLTGRSRQARCDSASPARQDLRPTAALRSSGQPRLPRSACARQPSRSGSRLASKSCRPLNRPGAGRRASSPRPAALPSRPPTCGAGLPRDQAAGGDVPVVHAALVVCVHVPGRHRAQVDRGRPAAPDVANLAAAPLPSTSALDRGAAVRRTRNPSPPVPRPAGRRWLQCKPRGPDASRPAARPRRRASR